MHLKNKPFRLVFSILILGSLCCLEPVIAEECKGVPPELDEWIDLIGDANDSGAELGQAERFLKGIRLGYRASEALCECGVGSNVMGCYWRHVDADLVCDAYDVSGFPDYTNPFSVIAMNGGPPAEFAEKAFEQYSANNSDGLNLKKLCDDEPEDDKSGEPTGPICCKFYPDNNCHTSINPPSVVSCLGAPPPFQPSYHGKAARMLASKGASWCHHIRECVPSSLFDDSPPGQAQRFGQWFESLVLAYEKAIYGDEVTKCTADLPLFVGCKGWMDVVEHGRPYLTLNNSDALPNGPDAFRFQQDLFGSAALRVMFAIPNGWLRYEHVMSRTWTQRQRDTYIGDVDAVAALTRWLSPCGLELLQASLPNHWQLLAVPYPEETESDRDETLNWQDACVPGAPPSGMLLSASASGAQQNITVRVSDPEAKANEERFVLLAIDWGDGAITAHSIVAGGQATFSHSFEAPGSFSASVIYINEAGLFTTGTIELSPSVGAGATDQSYFVSSVSATVESFGATGTVPDPIEYDRYDAVVNLMIEDSDGDLHFVRRDAVPIPGSQPSMMGADSFVSVLGAINARRLVWQVDQRGALTGGTYRITSLAVQLAGGGAETQILALDPTLFTISEGAGEAVANNGGINLRMVHGAEYRYELPH